VQQITVKEVKGPLGRGEKKFYAVVDDKGAEFTTFDSKVSHIPVGSIINLEPKVEGRYVNIVKWELVKEAPHPPAPGPSDSAAMLEQTRLANRVRLQVAAIQELGLNYRAGMASQEEEALYRSALGMIMKPFAPAPAQTAAAKPAPAEEAINPEDIIFEQEEPTEPIPKNVGEMLTRAREKGYSRADVMKYLEISDIGQIKDIALAWHLLSTGLFKKKEEARNVPD